MLFEVLGAEPPFVDVDPTGSARWWARDAVSFQGTPQGELADARIGSDGTKRAAVVDDELPESLGGEFGGERRSHRRAPAGRSQSEVGRVLTDHQPDVLERDAQPLGDLARRQPLT